MRRFRLHRHAQKPPRNHMFPRDDSLRGGRVRHDCARLLSSNSRNTSALLTTPYDLQTDSRRNPGRCSGPGVGVHGGARTIGGSINATSGAQRASTARPRPGTGSGALSGAVSTT